MTSKLNQTERGMLARGIPSDIAEVLTNAGYTISALQSKSLPELASLGISPRVAKKILSDRPPIPPVTLMKLLFENKWTCCVCRRHDQPVVVHHIEAWAVSRSHAAGNLVVLCPNDHAKAHSNNELTQSLTPPKLRDAKRRWEMQVKRDDSDVIRKAAQTAGEHWYFFNLVRLHEMAEHGGIDLSSLDHYDEAGRAGILDDKGHLVPESSNCTYAYAGRHSILRYAYAKDLFMRILAGASIENVSDRFDRSDIGTLIPNDLIYVEGAHTFRQLNGLNAGAGQDVEGTRSANSVRVVFAFDRWFATSCSAHSTWLSGRVVVGSFCRVGSISREQGRVLIKCTVLAICAELPGQRTRSYLSNSVHAYMRSVSDPDEVADW